jgi:hypothetical protein
VCRLFGIVNHYNLNPRYLLALPAKKIRDISGGYIINEREDDNSILFTVEIADNDGNFEMTTSGEIAGYLLTLKTSDPKDLILEMAVSDPKYKGKGLIKELIYQLHTLGYRMISSSEISDSGKKMWDDIIAAKSINVEIYNKKTDEKFDVNTPPPDFDYNPDLVYLIEKTIYRNGKFEPLGKIKFHTHAQRVYLK